MDELTELVASANGRIGELRQTKIDELRAQRAALDAELEKLGDVSKPGKPRLPAALSGGETRTRAKSRPQFETPDKWFQWSGQGGIPGQFKDLGVTERSQLEQYRIKS